MDDFVAAVDAHESLEVALLHGALFEGLVDRLLQDLVVVPAVQFLNLAAQDQLLDDDVFLVHQHGAQHLQGCVVCEV